MKNYYECHITLKSRRADKEDLEEITNWKFSIIDGDPVLGDGVKSYLTKQYSTKLDLTEVTDFLLATSHLVQNLGFEVIREKIELVVYDDRKGL